MSKRIWTFEKCRDIAMKCNSNKEFAEVDKYAYAAALKYKWIKDFDWLQKERHPNGYWNKERCFEEAKKYSCRTEFQKGTSSAYAVAVKNKWLEDYTWFSPSVTALKWTYDACKEESKKYKTRGEFRKGSYNAYDTSIKKGWIDDFSWLGDPLDVISGKIDTVYVYEFIDFNSVYVGRTLQSRIKDRDRSHLYDEKDSVFRFAKENGVAVPEMKTIETGLTVREGADMECYWIDEYRKNGWTLINRIKGGSIGGLIRKWTYDRTYEEALKYNRIADFQRYSKTAYTTAVKKGWREDYVWLKHQKVYSYKEVYEIAKEYVTKADFRHGNPPAYNKARKKKWLDDFNWFTDNKKKTSNK